jgi:hypothetical protein
MLRKIMVPAALALSLIFPARLLAGGPPWLCLPLNGVTADNASACAELLTGKLADKVWHSGREPGIRIQPYKDDWYLNMYLNKYIALGDIEAALAGSEFSVPRDRLRLFGHAILELNAREASQELLADLEALAHVSVAEQEAAEGRLLVTVDMPYPESKTGRERESVGWESFQRCDFSSDQATRSEPVATAKALPGYDDFRKVVEKHGVTLNDIRWSDYYRCRPLGCAAAPAGGSK